MAHERPPKVEVATIGKGALIRGEVESSGDLSIEGRVFGAVRAKETVKVEGRVEGPIGARAVVLCSTAEVNGELRAESIAIEDGAAFEGRIEMAIDDAELGLET
jgi:cytoskeletal protein CcmA (bactofilin family)